MPARPHLKTPILEANLLLAIMAGDTALAQELMALLPKDARVILATGASEVYASLDSLPAGSVGSAPTGLTQFCEANALLAALEDQYDDLLANLRALPTQNRAWLQQSVAALASLCAQS